MQQFFLLHLLQCIKKNFSFFLFLEADETKPQLVSYTKNPEKVESLLLHVIKHNDSFTSGTLLKQLIKISLYKSSPYQ